MRYLIISLFTATILTSCMKNNGGEDGGELFGLGGGNASTAGTGAMLKSGTEFYRWLLSATQISETADANPTINGDDQSVQAHFTALRDRLPGSANITNLTSGSHQTAFVLSARVADRFITEDLNRPDASRLVFRGFATSGGANNRSFAAGPTGTMRDDARFEAMLNRMHLLLFGEAAPAAVIAEAKISRDEMLSGVASNATSPSSAQSRQVAVAIFAALAVGPRGVTK